MSICLLEQLETRLPLFFCTLCQLQDVEFSSILILSFIQHQSHIQLLNFADLLL